MDGQDLEKVDGVVSNLLGVGKGGLASFIRGGDLRKLEFFRDCNPDFVSRVIDGVDCKFFNAGDRILEEGDEATSCYIINRGEVSEVVGGNEVAKHGNGAILGETVLLGVSQRRTASIIALTVCDIRIVHKSEFHSALKRFPKERERFRKEAQRHIAEIAKKNPKKDSEPDSPKPRRRSLRVAPVLTKLQSQGFNLDEVTLPARRRSQGDLPSLDPSQKLPSSSDSPKLPVRPSRRRSTGSTHDITPRTQFVTTPPTVPNPYLDVLGQAAAPPQSAGIIDGEEKPSRHSFDYSQMEVCSVRRNTARSQTLGDLPPASLSRTLHRRLSAEKVMVRSCPEMAPNTIPIEASRTKALEHFLAIDDLSRLPGGDIEDGFSSESDS